MSEQIRSFQQNSINNILRKNKSSDSAAIKQRISRFLNAAYIKHSFNDEYLILSDCISAEQLIKAKSYALGLNDGVDIPSI
jgi:hypothetical protein